MTAWAVVAFTVVLLAPGAPEVRRPGGRAVGPGSGTPGRVVATAGRLLRRSLGRSPDPAADRRWGWTAVASLGLTVVSPPLGLLTPVLVAGATFLHARRSARRAQAGHEAALPEVLELVAAAIRAGGTVPAAMALLVERGPVATVGAFRAVQARAAAGLPLAAALDELPRSLGEPYRPLSAALISAVADGAPLVSVVTQLAADAHDARRRAAEAAARQVPVRLLLPLVCCTLPAVLVVTVVPLVLAGGGLFA